MCKFLVKVELVSDSKVTVRSTAFSTVGYEESKVIVSVVFKAGETEFGLSEIDCYTVATWVTEIDESTTPLTVIVKDWGVLLIYVKPWTTQSN
jgi:hypothetical protein